MNIILIIITSYRYWKLSPDQATVDPERSPGDPIAAVRTVIVSDANVDNEKRENEERFSDEEVGPSGSSVDGNGEFGPGLVKVNDSPV